jgi:hypothetical protein
VLAVQLRQLLVRRLVDRLAVVFHSVFGLLLLQLRLMLVLVHVLLLFLAVLS